MSEVALVQETAASPEVVTLADCSPAQQIEQRYLAAVNALVDDAVEHENLPILADVLAWTLGRVIAATGRPMLPETYCAAWAATCAILPSASGHRPKPSRRGRRGSSRIRIDSRFTHPSPI